MRYIQSLLPLLFLSCTEKSVFLRSISDEDLSASRIIGGQTAQEGEFPFVVNIWLNQSKDSYREHLCGGSLISERWVLTAAHCVMDEISESEERPFKAHELELIIGSDKLSGREGVRLGVKSIHPHPEYSWPHHDLALIQLTVPVRGVVPIILNRQGNLALVKQHPKAQVVGWGLFANRDPSFSLTLKKTEVPLISAETCQLDPYVKEKKWVISEDILCAETQFSKNAACAGDSGGPLFVKLEGQFLQLGVVSWGSSCDSRAETSPSNVEGYASVGEASSWIESVTRPLR